MKAPRIALSIVAFALVSLAAGCQNPCGTNERQLEITNNSSQEIWVGDGGSAVRAACVTGNTECLPAKGNYSKDGTCNCGGNNKGVLACPGVSDPTKDPGLANYIIGTNCVCATDGDCRASATDPERCGLDHLCHYYLPEPAERLYYVPTANPYEIGPGGTSEFCVAGGSVTYPTPARTAAEYQAERVSKPTTRKVANLQAPTPTPTAAQLTSPVWWGGNIFARTGCQPDGTNCATADCAAKPNSYCIAGGAGGTKPATLAEFTLQTTEQDFYDITVINGVNLRAQMAPIPTVTATPGKSSPDYWCKVPGKGANCDWNYQDYISKVPVLATPTPTPAAKMIEGIDPASLDLPAVEAASKDYTTLLALSLRPCNSTIRSPDGTYQGCPDNTWYCTGNPGACIVQCQSNNDCPTGLQCLNGADGNKYCQCIAQSACSGSQVCGSQWIPGKGVYLQQCGSFGGWWTVDDLCGVKSNVVGNPYVGQFNCGQPILDGNFTTTTNLFALLGCTEVNGASCYNTTSTNNICCGCATASSNPLATLWPSNATESCKANNPTWAGVVQPLIANLKQACSTTYTYPYDDPTSTFYCRTDSATNMLGYKITFGNLPPLVKP